MADDTPKTFVHHLMRWAAERPDQPAIHGKDKDGNWVKYTWAEYLTAARETAKGIIALGHEPGDCVAIVGANRPEWVICQFGIMAARGIPAPGYASNTPNQVAHILRNSESKIAIADSKHLLDQYRAAKELDGDLPVEHYVCMVDGEDADAMTLDALRELGRQQDDAELDKRISEIQEDETCLLIYTSGTTGVAKGVMLEHGGICAMIDGLMTHADLFDEADSYRVVSYLPLCHVAEQVMTNLLQMGSGGQVFFCPEMSQVKDFLVEVRPTLFVAVPRVWEKFQAALEAKLAQATGIKAKLAAWARKTELAAVEAELATGEKVSSLGRTFANKLVISKVKSALGLDELKLAGTAAAPISTGTLRFFASLGIPIHEAYGMSETTALVTVNPVGRARFGTVGVALPGVEIKIAEDGEIICRGRNMSRGYLRMPDKTAELIDDEGWLHTGDIGELDADGFLKITGRKKDILITAGGKNVAPAEMESHINQIVGVGQVVVVGDRKPYLSALITLDPENLDKLAAAAGVDQDDLSTMAKNEKVVEWLQAQIESECNAKVARYQTIKRISVLPVEFSVDGGELTPTLKVKRNVVAEKYKDEIAELFA